MTRTQTRRIFGRTTVGVGLLLSALVAVPSCSGAEESLVSPCESELECGQPCDLTTSCGVGKYCSAQETCTAECIPGDGRCGSGKTCNGSGRCVEGGGIIIGPGGGGSGSSGGSSGVCADADINLGKQIPTVLLLVDQSASMNAEFGMSDRWQVLRTALMNQQDGIVSTLQDEVRFGLSLYSGRNGMAPCPALTNVAPMLNNYAAIDAAYPVPTASIIDDTPTGESIDAAAAALLLVQEEGPKVIVLATDGEPDSCATPDPQTPAAREMTVKAAEDAFAQGIFTFYISVGNEVADEHATMVANVGQGYGREDMTQRFYRANNQAELANAFAMIVNGVRSCAFALNGMVVEGAENKGTVTLNGMTLTLGDPNGWRLSSPTTIEVLGTACETVKNAEQAQLSAKFACGSIVPIKPPA